MTRVRTAALLEEAQHEGVGVGAFNVIHLETAEALVRGAEQAGRPVILQISENCVAYHGGLEPIALASLSLARRASVGVAVHLDHAESPDLAREAIELDLDSIMFDASRLDYVDNVRQTAEVVGWAHAAGVSVEGELGRIGGKDGAHAFGVRTDPDEAIQFVAETGIDSLAVAVGSSHAMTERSATLDVELIAILRRAVPVPLVLHGSSGADDANIVAAIRAGMTKINVSTHLNIAFTEAIRRYLDQNPTTVDSRKYVSAGREAVAVEAGRLLALFASAGQ